MRLWLAALVALAVGPAAAQTNTFPEIRDPGSVKITLSRNGPVYDVEIDGDGSVTFNAPTSVPMARNGPNNVAVPGRHRSKISRDDVAALVDAFRQTNFFALLNDYRGNVADGRGATVSIAFDRQRKSVLDDVGERAGMPASVRALEQKIDDTAGTGKWVGGNAQTVAALTAEGWDFESHREANLRLISAMSHDGNLVVQLLAAGVPTDSDYGCVGLNKAVTARDFATAYLLVRAHAPFVVETARAYGGQPCDVTGAAVERNDLEGVAWLLRHGADASEHDRTGISLLMRAKGEGEMARLLLSDGADLNARNDKGQTALMLAGAWPELVTQLLQHGADPEAKDAQGRTALELYPPGSPAAQILTGWRQSHSK